MDEDKEVAKDADYYPSMFGLQKLGFNGVEVK